MSTQRPHDECPHGGLAVGGRCVLDAGHPEVICPACGEVVCPCGTCWGDHHRRRACAFTRDALAVRPEYSAWQN